jgi:putative nucleotidyltransferase with HDIG domain
VYGEESVKCAMGVEAIANSLGMSGAAGNGGADVAGRAASPAASGAAFVIPPAVLESLAARVRPNGAFLVVLRPDGTVAWHDQAAGVFFRRFVLPLLQYRDPTSGGDALSQKLKSLTQTSPVQICDDLPGVTLAISPHVERKNLAAFIVIASRNAGFRLTEDVARVCGRLGLDGQWLVQQAEQVPALGHETLQRHSRMLMSMLGDQLRLAGLQQELDSLSGQLASTYEELSLIYTLSGGMKVNRRTSEFFKQACLDVMDVMNVRGMGVALCEDGESEAYQTEPVLYGGMSLPPGTVHRLTDEIMANLRTRKSALLVNRLPKDKTFAWLAEHANQLLAVPLMRQEQVLGCLFALDKVSVAPGVEFDTVDSKLLTSIANESAIYLENAMLFEDVRGLMMGLLHSLTSAVDAKDAYTCGHSERVALLSRYLARAAGLDDNLVERIYMGGLLHDVGKIGVPEAVLQKTGRLTDEEFAQIKKHPEIGARILRDVKQIEDIIPGVLYHHERYDGKGYPSKLAGSDIPLMGRLICLADCFDAMTSSRTYRKALPLEVALTEIRRCSGTQFDPQLTDAFLSIPVAELRQILRDHQEQARRFELPKLKSA